MKHQGKTPMNVEFNGKSRSWELIVGMHEGK